jgi:ATP-dependent exoDNAse (exonuclease V) alpha subunit
MKEYKLKDLTPFKDRQYKIDYEQELNESQLSAVKLTKGPALVIAGAGTGKTRTLVYRVARLVEDGNIPEGILLLTFTRKSAKEMLPIKSLEDMQNLLVLPKISPYLTGKTQKTL